MGFFEEDPSLIITHLLYKTAVVIAVLRWVFSWSIRFRNRYRNATTAATSADASSSSASSSISSQMIRDSLVLTTYADVSDRSYVPSFSDTCAVCLNQLRENDLVRELRNCCHVFHKECIDRWIDYDLDDNHRSCPLCRAPLLTSFQKNLLSSGSSSWPKNEPSWAVERILYLFGDDLLM